MVRSFPGIVASRSDPPTHAGATTSIDQEPPVREKRRHFLQLKSNLEAARREVGQPEVLVQDNCGATQQNRPVIPDAMQLPVNDSTRSPTSSLNYTVAQSMCSSMVETIEASDLLEELSLQ
ncbi:hypothetical protein IV203_010446 [Nitzschia inconspicua]|uniref:Uncharacterized protein n=1 Tax=Nitzschia inconspicua TaxID=303405 RepID=A0A9K3PLF1_9STRA|nr:hypothetical protein IV203_010446 [Nitzschia inconspicua]